MDPLLFNYLIRVADILLSAGAESLGCVDIRPKGAIIALSFPISTPSFPRKRESGELGTAFICPPSP